MYDPTCHALAKHFLLADGCSASEEMTAELAQHVQDAVEDWLGNVAWTRVTDPPTMNVKLYDQAGLYLRSFEVACPLPDFIRWGERTFRLGQAGTFLEGVTWTAPETEA